MFIIVPAFVICFYLIVRLIASSKLTQQQKIVLSCLIALGSSQFALDLFIEGGLNSEHLPSTVVVVQGWIFFTLILLLLFSLVKDAIFFCTWVKKKIKRLSLLGGEELGSSFMPQKENLSISPEGFSPQRRAFMLTVAAAIPAAYAVREAVAIPKVTPMSVAINNLPNRLEGLRIAHISDLHISPMLTESWAHQVVERVNNLQPDLILLSGDMIDGLPSQRGRNVDPLKRLKATYGVFGCVGNHEYYSDYVGWLDRFSDLGIVMLENSHKVLTINGESLAIAGVTDIAAERFSLPMPDPQIALAGVPQETTSIMLDHRPANAKNNAKAGANLQLSGHTHGGQILGMDLIVRGLNNGYVRGWYTVSGMPMYVSSGAGLWHGFPVRLGVPSEIPCITLKCKEFS